MLTPVRRKRPGSPRAAVEQLYRQLVKAGHKDGTLLDRRSLEAWIASECNLISRQAVDDWIWTLENHGMVRRTTAGPIRFLNPPNQAAPFEPLVPGRHKHTEGQPVAA